MLGRRNQDGRGSPVGRELRVLTARVDLVITCSANWLTTRRRRRRGGGLDVQLPFCCGITKEGVAGFDAPRKRTYLRREKHASHFS